jgi:predicted DNA binding protein
MILLADVSAPADSIPMGWVFDDHPAVTLRIERIDGPPDDRTVLVWVQGAETEFFVRSTGPAVEEVSALTTVDEGTLYEVRFSTAQSDLLDVLAESDCELVSAAGTAQLWDIRLQFPSHGTLTAFRQRCADAGVSLSVRRLFTPRLDCNTDELTSAQAEALVTAYDRGYFTVPRQTSLTALATDLDISDSALSQRIRRGIATVLGETVVSGDR